jgi:hypothetical protein
MIVPAATTGPGTSENFCPQLRSVTLHVPILGERAVMFPHGEHRRRTITRSESFAWPIAAIPEHSADRYIGVQSTLSANSRKNYAVAKTAI